MHSLHLPSARSIEDKVSSSVLIYLPPGASGSSAEQIDSTISTLKSNLQVPVVQINYRLSEHFKYPTPIHDMLCGYDWIVDNLLPKRSISQPGRSDSVGQLAIYGSHIGGGLASALALTECRKGEPGIVAAALHNPMIDWVSIDEALNSQARHLGAKNPLYNDASTLSQLQRLRYLRKTLFRRPENYFDPFASPILFFRSAGVDVPPPAPEVPVDDLEELSRLERQEAYEEEIGVASDTTDPGPQNMPVQPAMRKASRRFPSKALGLRLPEFHISTDATSPLADQAGELAKVLRQSFVRQSKDANKRSDFGRKVLMEGEEDEMDEDQKAEVERQMEDAKSKVELHVNNENQRGANLGMAVKWLRDRLGA